MFFLKIVVYLLGERMSHTYTHNRLQNAAPRSITTHTIYTELHNPHTLIRRRRKYI